MDGVTYQSWENPNAQDMSDIKVYMTLPTITDGVIENFVYEEFDSPSNVFIGNFLQHSLIDI